MKEWIEIEDPMMDTQVANYLDEYLHGNCHVFALAMHQEFGYQMQFLWDLSAEFHGSRGIKYGKALVHAFCVRPDQTLVDASGTISYRDAECNYGDVNEPEYETLTIDELLPLMNGKFLSKADERELNKLREHIRKYQSFYKEEFE